MFLWLLGFLPLKILAVSCRWQVVVYFTTAEHEHLSRCDQLYWRWNRIRSILIDANVYLVRWSILCVATKQDCANSYDFVLKLRRKTPLIGYVPHRKQSHSLPIRNLHQASHISLLPVDYALAQCCTAWWSFSKPFSHSFTVFSTEERRGTVWSLNSKTGFQWGLYNPFGGSTV